MEEILFIYIFLKFKIGNRVCYFFNGPVATIQHWCSFHTLYTIIYCVAILCTTHRHLTWIKKFFFQKIHGKNFNCYISSVKLNFWRIVNLKSKFSQIFSAQNSFPHGNQIFILTLYFGLLFYITNFFKLKINSHSTVTYVTSIYFLCYSSVDDLGNIHAEPRFSVIF